MPKLGASWETSASTPVSNGKPGSPTGWRNYYRYTSRARREFAKHDWWLWWRIKSWLGKKHGKASGRTLRRVYAESGGRRSGWRMRGRELTRFADAKRLLYPDRGL